MSISSGSSEANVRIICSTNLSNLTKLLNLTKPMDLTELIAL